jgi:hypothetical protein
MVLLSIPIGDPPHTTCGIALGILIQKVDRGHIDTTGKTVK